MDKSVQGVLGMSMDKIKEMVDVDTVIGNPITVEGFTLIPVSKVTYGFAGGGSDLPTKEAGRFGGGSGAGISITPIAFLSIQNGEIRVLPMIAKPSTVDGLIANAPEMVDKLRGVFSKKSKDEAEADEPVVKKTAPSDAAVRDVLAELGVEDKHH